MTEKTYKPINVSKISWERYSDVATRLSEVFGTSLSIPKMLDMAVTHLERNYPADTK